MFTCMCICMRVCTCEHIYVRGNSCAHERTGKKSQHSSRLSFGWRRQRTSWKRKRRWRSRPRKRGPPPLSVSCSRPSSGFHDLGGVEASTAEEGGVLTLRTLRNQTSIELENGNGTGRVSGIESGGGRGETRVRNGRVERNKTELEERLCAVTASFASPLAAAR